MLGIIELIKDPYERKARVTPGLLVALPVLVPLVCAYGPKHPMLTSVLALLGGCGAIFALANVARGRGKKLEARLVQKWGGMPTTLALRHRDAHTDSVSKRRYHELITAKLGVTMPVEAEEANDPAAADDSYIGATKRLIELTRSDKGLLFKENIAYGFHRNMVAMKDVGLLTCLVGLVYGLILANVLQLKPFALAPVNFADPGLASSVTLLISVAMLLAWLFYFNAETVKTIGFAYADRLFECLSKLKAQPKPKGTGTAQQKTGDA
jgi:hypothetical protein